MNNSLFTPFTRLFPLSKTLRFELRPQGKTMEHITQFEILSEGEAKARGYRVIKDLLDRYHKHFIEKSLIGKRLNLKDYVAIRNSASKNADEKAKKTFVEFNSKLRKEISLFFKNRDEYSKLFKREVMHGETALLTSEDWLPEGLTKEETEAIGAFKGFHGYFGGLNENRENMYKAEEQSTAIAYRLVHENLPKFAENMKIYELIKAVDIPQELWDRLIADLQDELTEITGGPVDSLDDLFAIDSFNLTLTQRGIDLYNTILGGKTMTERKIQGINEIVNTQHNQKLGKTERNKKIPKLRMLYKQILSDRESLSFLPPKFETDAEMLDTINNAYRVLEDEGVFENLQTLLCSLDKYDLEHIYLCGGLALRTISQHLFGNYAKIDELLATDFEKNTLVKKSGKHEGKLTIKEQGERDKFVNKEWHSIAELNRIIHDYAQGLESIKDDSPLKDYQPICAYFTQYSKTRNHETRELTNKALSYSVRECYKCLEGIFNTNTEKENHMDESIKTKIKQLLDSVMNLLHLSKQFKLPDDCNHNTDLDFYGEFNQNYDQLKPFTKLYDRVRNYLTKKPYSVEKVKLNFHRPTLLDGWDKNKEADNLSVILRKGGRFYLAVMNAKMSGANKSFMDIPKVEGPAYEKMVYKLLPDSVKMMPKVFFAKSNIDHYAPSAEIMEIKEKASYKNNAEHRAKFIAFYQKCIKNHPEWDKAYQFQFRAPSEYESYRDFCDDVDQQGYCVSWENVPVSYMDELVEEGKVFLFEIYNKDFSEMSKGRKNLHTLYWNALFSAKNLLEERIYKLNGKAEIFYRKRSILPENIITHPKGLPIKAKNLANKNKTNVFDYDLIKDRRFTVDKIHFHCPITMNFRSSSFGEYKVNSMVQQAIKEFPDLCYIGIDRGERHLLYLTVVDSKGNILNQESLNIIGDKEAPIKTDYHKLLDSKEADRKEAREKWLEIENIKELKSGYLSQVVNRIAELMLEHNAIVVLEDLNFGFKRGRFKVEKQVYQKFEKALIEKLNYLVIKKIDENNLGGLYHALQLTNKFESFQKLGKQTGFLFYVPAANTSKIDPTSGFIDLLHPKYENIAKATAFFGKFDFIKYNIQTGYFEFGIDYSQLTSKEYGTRAKWTLCTFGKERYVYKTEDKTSHVVDATEELKTIFDKAGVSYADGRDLKDILSESKDATLLKSVYWVLRLILAMRYSNAKTGRDFILSPVKNAKGEFFNSELSENDKSENGIAKLPKDADANGAYHIALKGLMLSERIRASDLTKKIDLKITNSEWFNYVQLRTLS